jgi:hypothetical protein
MRLLKALEWRAIEEASQVPDALTRIVSQRLTPTPDTHD